MRVKTEFRVCAVVDDDTWEQDPVKRAAILQGRAEALKADIKRHCDGYTNVWIEWDSRCSYCKLNWETEPSGEPVCCAKAQEDWATERALKTTSISAPQS